MNRNTLFLGLILFFSPFFTNAQSHDIFGQVYIRDQKKPLFIGIKTGLSIPSLQAGESKNVWNKNYKSIVRSYVSVFGEVRIFRHFSIQTELAYAAQGGKRDDIQPFGIPENYVALFQQAFSTPNDYVFANLSSTSHINFIQMPIMLKYQYIIALHHRLSVYALFGPYFGYMVAAKQIVKSADLHVYVSEDPSSEIAQNLVKGFFGSSIDTTINSYPELHKFNMGIQGGVGFQYIFGRGKDFTRIGKGRVFIEGGGNYGLLYLQKGADHGKNRIGAGTVLVGVALDLNYGKYRDRYKLH